MPKIKEPDEVRELMSGLIDLIYRNMPKIEEGRFDIEIKPDGSPVTQSDVYVENLVKHYVEEKFPDVTFVGEENFSELISTVPEGYYAILDPIDGTENFCSGLKEWGVSFTLWYGNQHLGSLLFLPELGEHLMTGDMLTPIHSRIRGFSSSMCDEILEGMRSTQESRLMGCAVYNLYNVIRGSFARFTNPRGAYSWDLLPGLMLAREHNCDIEVEGKPYHGEFLEPGRKYRVDIRHRYDLHTR
ncbi:MAG: inositol monophosphatase family protein [Halomonas sp.]|uniref:inositol monophosphatase family protein n=1 Tax=Halomonas sp. TaxID=1486246 RepID=UPI003F99E01F